PLTGNAAKCEDSVAKPRTTYIANARPAPAVPTESDVRAKLSGLDVPFVHNDGQADARVSFYAQTFAGTVFVTKTGEIVYSLLGPGIDGEKGTGRAGGAAERHGPGWTLVERFDRGSVRPRAEEPAPTNVSSFLGSEPKRWRSHAATYAGVGLGEVWPGIE